MFKLSKIEFERARAKNTVKLNVTIIYPNHIDLAELTVIAERLSDRVQGELKGQGGEVRLKVSPERVKASSGLLTTRLIEVLAERGINASARQWTGEKGSGLILVSVK